MPSTVYQALGGSSTGSTINLILPNPVVAGRSLVVYVGREGSTDRTFTPSSSLSDIFTAAIFNIPGTILREIQMNVCLSAIGGSTTVTVTASGTSTWSAAVLEVDALHATLYDDTRGASDEGAVSTNHNCADSPGITSANDILLCGLGQASGSLGTITYPTGHAGITGLRTTSMFSYKLEPAGVSGQQAPWSSLTSRQLNNALQAFRFAAAGGSAFPWNHYQMMMAG